MLLSELQVHAETLILLANREDDLVASTLLRAGDDKAPPLASSPTRASELSPGRKATYGPFPALLQICALLTSRRARGRKDSCGRLGMAFTDHHSSLNRIVIVGGCVDVKYSTSRERQRSGFISSNAM